MVSSFSTMADLPVASLEAIIERMAAVSGKSSGMTRTCVAKLAFRVRSMASTASMPERR